MDGVLIIDKPAGMTSHDVVNRVRKILKTKKVGHTGTLDPFATGVLVMLVGKATRLAQFVDKAAKEYVAEIRFGFATDTGDLTGTPIGNEETPQLSRAAIERVLPKFRGEIEQVPPMYSAKKVGGKKLYELARKGETVERKPFLAKVHELQLLSSGEKTIRILVACSAGTYIRTLAEDIGKELGTGAHLTSLRRTAAGQFDLNEAIALEGLERSETPSDALLPIEHLISHLPKFELSLERIETTRNGLSTRVDRDGLQDHETVAMLAPDGSIIAIGYFDAAERRVKPKIVLV